MPRKNLHARPFDETTKVKLVLFSLYVREWLPVFLASNNPYWKTVNIFDFFAGPGRTTFNENGSPLLTINEVFPYAKHIKEKSLNLNLYFNEYTKEKFDSLSSSMPS